jgi:hypothetical protein
MPKSQCTHYTVYLVILSVSTRFMAVHSNLYNFLGSQVTLVKCVREHNQQVVLDKRCSHHDKPLPQTIRCSTKPCPAE